jgi:hypothetical protein
VFNLSIRDGAILSEFTQQPPRALPEPTNPNRLNPGENAFSVSGGRAIHFGPLGAGLWDVQARQMSRVLDRRPTDAACFIPSVGAGDDGAVIAVTDGGFEVVVFDNSGVRTRAITMPVHARTTSLAVSPDGQVDVECSRACLGRAMSGVLTGPANAAVRGSRRNFAPGERE